MKLPLKLCGYPKGLVCECTGKSELLKSEPEALPAALVCSGKAEAPARERFGCSTTPDDCGDNGAVADALEFACGGGGGGGGGARDAMLLLRGGGMAIELTRGSAGAAAGAGVGCENDCIDCMDLPRKGSCNIMGSSKESRVGP